MALQLYDPIVERTHDLKEEATVVIGRNPTTPKGIEGKVQLIQIPGVEAERWPEASRPEYISGTHVVLHPLKGTEGYRIENKSKNGTHLAKKPGEHTPGNYHDITEENNELLPGRGIVLTRQAEIPYWLRLQKN